MWPRKRLDIDGADLWFAAQRLVTSWQRPAVREVVGDRWIRSNEALVCLSVRTGWDLFLTAMRWPRGTEIVMSAVTIPDMPRIVEHHALVPVPVDVDSDRLEPSPDDLERVITPRTRAIAIAHLFGGRVDMEPIIEAARRHRLLVIEDCAQAFVGSSYAGNADTDVAMFSFGPIKTATALGGAVLRIRDPRLYDQMERLQRAYRLQSRAAYTARLAKYAAFTVASRPRVFAAVVRGCQLLGIDFDRVFSSSTHSFCPECFYDQIRRQPCVPLVRMLQRRLASFGENVRLRRRTQRGWWLASRLPPHTVLGAADPFHTFWVLPVRVDSPAYAVERLRAAGFDATGRSSLAVVSAARDQSRCLAPWLRDTIYLPNGDDMGDDEFDRMLSVLGQAIGSRRRVVESTPRGLDHAGVAGSVADRRAKVEGAACAD